MIKMRDVISTFNIRRLKIWCARSQYIEDQATILCFLFLVHLFIYFWFQQLIKPTFLVLPTSIQIFIRPPSYALVKLQFAITKLRHNWLNIMKNYTYYSLNTMPILCILLFWVIDFNSSNFSVVFYHVCLV